jgi:NADH-quinone oxidoreductase subunit J
LVLNDIVFFIAAAGALAGAIGVVVLRNPFYSVIALVGHLIALATLFLLLRAEFLAAAQVVVYAGAVMVLYVFVVAYVGGVEEPLGEERGTLTALGAVFAAALLAEIMVAVIGSGLAGLTTRGPHVPAGFGSPTAIGTLLLSRFLVVFEAASFLLLIAAVAAVLLARRRRGLEQLGGEELPERAGRAPLPSMNGGDGAAPHVDDATPVPAGTAEGPGDPTVEHSPAS